MHATKKRFIFIIKTNFQSNALLNIEKNNFIQPKSIIKLKLNSQSMPALYVDYSEKKISFCFEMSLTARQLLVVLER